MGKNTLLRLLTAFLCLILIICALPVGASSVKVDYDDINDETSDKMKEEIESLAEARNEILANIQKAEDDKADAYFKRELYITMNALYEDELAAIERRALVIENELDKLGKEAAELQAKYDETYNNMRSFLRMTHEEGSANYIEIILGADNLSDLLSRVERVSGLIGYNDRIMKRLEKQSADVADKRKQQQAKAAEQEQALADVEAKKNEIAAWNTENEATLKAIEDSITSMGSEYDAVAAAEESLNAEFEKLVAERIAAEKARLEEIERKLRAEALAAAERKRLEEEKAYQEALAAAARAQGYMWPLPSAYIRLSSVYNEVRTIDELGYVNKVHYGIDIPAPRGTNIYAAKTGTVIKSTYHSSYGYYIMIDHGDGSQTVYAHCSKLLVKAGVTVKQGDVIAQVGTTGSSTGNHLHFELRLAGRTVDPMKYLIKP